MTDKLISIILPVYNQGDHIDEIVRDYEAVLERIPNPHEILLVVNNSRDNSLSACEALAGEFDSVRVLHSEQGGWGLAVNLGIQAAKGDLICYTNSARTTPQDLQLMVLYADANPGVVIKANRRIRESLVRRLGSLLYNLECRVLFELASWDVNGTPKVFPGEYAKLRNLQCKDDLIDAEFNAICQREKYPMLEVPIFAYKRHGGASTTNFRSAFKMYLGAYRLYRSMREQ